MRGKRSPGEKYASEIAAAANRTRYSNPEEVSGYLSKPHHALRVRLAVDALLRELNSWGCAVSERATVVEVGGASGIVAEMVSRGGHRVILTDREALVMRAAKGFDRVAFDAEKGFPFRDGVVDGVLVGDLIEHVFDPLELLREAWRVLRPGGVLVMTTPNLAALQDRVGFLFGASPRHVDALHEYRRLHIRPFTKKSLANIVNAAGFTIRRVESNFVILRSRWIRDIHLRFLARMLPGIGASLIVSAVKEVRIDAAPFLDQLPT